MLLFIQDITNVIYNILLKYNNLPQFIFPVDVSHILFYSSPLQMHVTTTFHDPIKPCLKNQVPSYILFLMKNPVSL